MPAEVAPIIYVLRGGAITRTVGGEISMPHSEPCTWSVRLDNSEGLYGPSSSVANVRASESVYHTIVVTDWELESTWSSPQLIVEDYDYDGADVATISGRCRLAQLDRDDQVIEAGNGLSTAEDVTVAQLLALIASHCGLSVTGAPTRVVPQYHLVGNPLQMFRDLLEPTHGFRMGAAGAIECFSLAVHPAAGTLKDDEDLEVLRFRRSTELRNRVTVERLVEAPGPVVLFSEARSGGTELGVNGPHSFSQPSRNWWFVRKIGYRGAITSISPKGGSGEPVGQQPLQGAYVSNDPTHGFTFVYEVKPGASEWGPYTPNWDIEIHGYPIDVDPPPMEGYSVTVSAGAGDRPATEPFSAISINSQAAAAAAAQALLDKYLREGQVLNLATRLRPNKIWKANATVKVEDFASELDLQAVLEVVSVSWDEESDTGTITYECTFEEDA